MVGSAALVGGVSGGVIAITEIEVQGEEDKEKLKIFNWPESYGAVVSLLNVSKDLYVESSNGVYKIKDNINQKIIKRIKGVSGYISSLTVTTNGTIYAATFTSGVYQCLVGQNTFTKITDTPNQVNSLVTMGNNVYIGTKTSDCYDKLFMIGINGLITEVIDWSESNGEVWNLAVVGNDLYVGSRTEVIDDKFVKGKLYKSVDGGFSFTEILGWNKDYGAVVSLLNMDNNLYIGSKNYNDKNNNNYQGKLLFKKIK